MPRLKLAPLERYGFAVELSVRVTDLNFAGHLGNDRLLSLVHEARVAFLADAGLAERDDEGGLLLVGDTAVVYLGEAFAGDRLRFEVAAGEPTSRGLRLFYRVSRVADDAAIALVETGLVCFDQARRETCGLPSRLRALCADPTRG